MSTWTQPRLLAERNHEMKLQIEQLNQQLQEKDTTISSQSYQVEQLQHEISILNRALEASAVGPKTGIRHTLTYELAKKQEELHALALALAHRNDLLKQTEDNLTAAFAEMGSKDETIAELEAERSQLRDTIEEKERMIRELQDTVARGQTDGESLADRLASVTAQLKSSELKYRELMAQFEDSVRQRDQKIHSMELERARITNEYQRLKEEQDQRNQIHAMQQRQIRADWQTLKHEQAQFQEQQQRLVMLDHDNVTLKRQRDEAMRAYEEAKELLDAQANRLRQTEALLSQQNSRGEADSRMIDELKAKIQELQGQINGLNKQRDDTMGALQTTVSDSKLLAWKYKVSVWVWC